MTDPEVEAFVSEYRAAFDALDADRISALYDTSTTIVSEQGTGVLPDRSSIRENMVALTDRYRKRGFERAVAHHVVIDHVSGALASVDVVWTLTFDGGSDTFSTRYWLADRGAGPKVTAVLAYGEKR